MVGEAAARNVANMQLHELLVVRRVAHRKTAPRAVAQKYVQILSGDKLEALGGRQLEIKNDHIFCDAFYFCQP